jgi:uncharacterized damage-inducible protein DinB
MLAAHTYCAQLEPLWIHLRVEMEEDIKAMQDKLHADWAKVDAYREKRKADIEAFDEMMEGREAERKAYVTICTTEFNIQNSAFCPQIISMCVISFLE